MDKAIAVIGSAGRRDDGPRMSRALYDAMYAETLSCMARWGCETAVSGGAALADHLAVRAYLEGRVSRLKLFLPARFDGRAFVPNPSIRFNPGATCNQYHRAFSEACGLDSLAEISAACRKGAEVEVFEGFHLRNSEVAEACSHMLAFTFGASDSGDLLPPDEAFSDAAAAGLKDGGTAHTWGACWRAGVKRHVRLGPLARSQA